MSPANGVQITGGNMLLWWASPDQDAGDAVTYRLEICADNNFNAPAVVGTGLTGTGVFIKTLSGADQLKSLTAYYWRVRAERAAGRPVGPVPPPRHPQAGSARARR